MKGCDRVVLAVVSGFLWAAPQARANLLFDTVIGDGMVFPTPGASYFVHNAPATSSFAGDDLREAVAIDVAPGLAFAIDSIVLNVEARFSASQRLAVALSRSDAAGLPGAPIYSYVVTNLPVHGISIYPLTVIPTPERPVLFPGRYWLALSTPDASNQSEVFWKNRSDVLGAIATMSAPLNGTGWNGATDSPLPQVRVSGTLVPEPGTRTLVGAGAALLAATARRRRGR